ncbi:2345_t:CDS:2, partial [Entrophospora sp. SA101]
MAVININNHRGNSAIGVDLADLGGASSGAKNIDWLVGEADRNNTVLISADGGNMARDLQTALGGAGGTGAIDTEENILQLLNDLCTEMTLLNHARKAYRNKLQRKIDDRGDDQGDLAILLGNENIGQEDERAVFNLADIYCLERFIDDFFGDDSNIETKVIRELFGGSTRFASDIIDGGNFYEDKVNADNPNNDFVNFRKLFARVVNANFSPVDDEDSNNNIIGNNAEDNNAGFDNLIGKLALMTQLVQQREECLEALAKQRGVGDTDELINDFRDNFSGNRVFRKVTEPDRTNNNTNDGDAEIKRYQGRSLTGTQAALAFASGVGASKIRRNGITQPGTNDPGHDLKTPTAEEQAIFNDDVVVLDTAAAEHHAALLLAHLRAAKNAQIMEQHYRQKHPFKSKEYFNEQQALNILKPLLTEHKLTLTFSDAAGQNVDIAKAKGCAETYAIKYFLTKFFLIPTTDELDPDIT